MVARLICVPNSTAYDNVFCSYHSEDTKNYANQVTVFNGAALPLIGNVFDGYNACLFAYGQTGSGKSYGMMGIGTGKMNEFVFSNSIFVPLRNTISIFTDDDHSKPDSEATIIPRFCYELFRRIDRMKAMFSADIRVSYFEIYNEKIQDSLAVTPTHLEHPQWGPYIENIHPVDSNFC